MSEKKTPSEGMKDIADVLLEETGDVPDHHALVFDRLGNIIRRPLYAPPVEPAKS